MDSFKQIVESLDPNSISIIFTLAIVLFTAVLLWFFTRKPSQNKNVLIVGTSNSGKTALFCQVNICLQFISYYIYLTKITFN